jgi:hypothetical protein
VKLAALCFILLKTLKFFGFAGTGARGLTRLGGDEKSVIHKIFHEDLLNDHVSVS